MPQPLVISSWKTFSTVSSHVLERKTGHALNSTCGIPSSHVARLHKHMLSAQTHRHTQRWRHTQFNGRAEAEILYTTDANSTVTHTLILNTSCRQVKSKRIQAHRLAIPGDIMKLIICYQSMHTNICQEPWGTKSSPMVIQIGPKRNPLTGSSVSYGNSLPPLCHLPAREQVDPAGPGAGFTCHTSRAVPHMPTQT